MRPDRARVLGFTLLEVLIALLLLSLALTALIRLSGLEARATTHLRDTTFAQWVAANAIAEARLRANLVAGTRREGETTLGQRVWRWQLDTQSTEEPSVLRLEARVFAVDRGTASLDDESPVTSLTGFAVQR
jgi:general secretion pathway protein I